MPNVIINSNRIEWGAVDYAICYVVSLNDEVVAFTIDCEYLITTEGIYKVQAVNEFGGLSEAATAISTSIESVVQSSTVVNMEIFTIEGLPAKGLQKGINIIRYTMSDGSVKTDKIYIK